MNTFTFTPDSFTCNGKTYPATFSMDAAGTVTVHAAGVIGNGRTIHVVFTPEHAAYSAAKAAALGAGQMPAEEAAPAEDQPAKIPEGYTATTTAAGNIITVSKHIDITEQEQPAADQPAPEQPADIPEGKKTRGPVPEKTFIGDSIQGKGYKIYFDGSTSRTRVIFDSTPTDAARAAVEKAGFYFSAAMNSWNKKLTFKAYRAALALSGELSALYA